MLGRGRGPSDFGMLVGEAQSYVEVGAGLFKVSEGEKEKFWRKLRSKTILKGGFTLAWILGLYCLTT